jgi:uncharacterized protein (TIGR02996 family)
VNHREGFLNALSENEDDVTTRLVFADWLDEQGEHEEADRHRKWPAAKAWLVRFCEQNNQPPDEEPDKLFISYDKLIELAWTAISSPDEDGFWFHCCNNDTMCYALQDNCGVFWQNWSIVTGVGLPPDIEERSSFTCGC